MTVLVCGMHRSGNSVVAHLLAAGAGVKLYDDPPWAQEKPRLVLNNARISQEMEHFAIVKCPRMAGYLDQVLSKFPELCVIWVHRDIRDIYASIREREKNGPGTTLLTFREIDILEEGASAFGLAAKQYARVLTACLEHHASRIVVIRYEEFVSQKENMLRQLAHWLGWPINLSAIRPLAAKQLGPARHKFEGIRGPGRFRTDLKSSELSELAPVVATWNSIVPTLRNV